MQAWGYKIHSSNLCIRHYNSNKQHYIEHTCKVRTSLRASELLDLYLFAETRKLLTEAWVRWWPCSCAEAWGHHRQGRTWERGQRRAQQLRPSGARGRSLHSWPWWPIIPSCGRSWTCRYGPRPWRDPCSCLLSLASSSLLPEPCTCLCCARATNHRCNYGDEKNEPEGLSGLVLRPKP